MLAQLAIQRIAADAQRVGGAADIPAVAFELLLQNQALGSVPLVWALGDTMAGLLAIFNIVAIVPLGGVALKLLKNFNDQRRKGIDPVFHREMLPELKNVEFWDGSDPVTRRSEEDRIVLRDDNRGR